MFHGKTEKAQDVLKKIRHSKDVENELNNIVKEYNKSQKDRMGKIDYCMTRFYRTVKYRLSYNKGDIAILQVIRIFVNTRSAF